MSELNQRLRLTGRTVADVEPVRHTAASARLWGLARAQFEFDGEEFSPLNLLQLRRQLIGPPPHRIAT